MNRLLFAVSILGLSGHLIMAQEKAITIKREQNRQAIEFRTSDGKIFRTLDVDQQNPYKPNFTPQRSNARGVKVGHSFTEGLVSKPGKSNIAVSYSYKAYSEDNSQLQDVGESTLIVYDESGNEIFKKRIEADNAGEPLMASNGKYVAVAFGGVVYDDVTLKVGFTIYNVETKSEVFHISTNDLSGAWVAKDVFVFAVPEGGSDRTTTYFVFDTTRETLYKKSYPIKIYRGIKRFENLGVIFLLPPDAERIEKYETNFKKVEQ